MARKVIPMLEKILSNSMPEPNSGCWLWLGHYHHSGYGRTNEHRKPVEAHRASYRVFKGAIPPGMHICHACDNKACVNPDHLWVGTALDNVRDRDNKGRGAKPPSGGHLSRVTASTAKQIRAASGHHSAVAREFGVSAQLAKRIRNGVTWRDI